MKYGFVIPGGDLPTVLELASEAEVADWDGVFYWDAIHIGAVERIYDAWVVLAGIAMRTKRIRIGAFLTNVTRRRPWKLAREAVTLDHLSNGRLIFPTGLGSLDDGGFTKVGEPLDRGTRAELLDEGLEILVGLWSGKPFSFHGQHFSIEEMTFLPAPVQSPRIPIWVVGAWPKPKSMQRALRYDGLIPTKKDPDGTIAKVSPTDIRSMRAYVAENRALASPFEIVYEGETPGDDPKRAAETVRPYAESGVTWWIESRWSFSDLGEVRERLRQGPPRVE